MSNFRVTIRTPDGLHLPAVQEHADNNRAACRQVLARHPAGYTASARIEDQTGYVRDALAVRMSGFPLIGGAA